MRKNDLKQAAIQVFSERGYHAAKVSDIVSAAGVAQGTFYLYFQSKQGLFGELLSDYLNLVTSSLSDWNIESLENLDQLRNDLLGIGIKLTEVMVENADLTRIFFQEALAVDPEFNETIRSFYDVLIQIIVQVNATCRKNGIYRQVDDEILAHCVVGMIERLVYQYVVNDRLTHATPESLVTEMIDLILFGASVPA
jgi:AcrR family transcriptional regulator